MFACGTVHVMYTGSFLKEQDSFQSLHSLPRWDPDATGSWGNQLEAQA